MTDSMKCPFCGAELQTDNEIARLIMWRCHTPGCLLNGWHSAEIIQHLIDGKKAQDSLKEISRLNQYIRKELAHQIPEEASKADNSIYTITFEIAKECRKGLHNKIEDKSDGR